mmetsp:Transcript_30887/g.80668  ORF Transcript_30887/g.80668 Transcript_30887/m.80668 type:complete len:86 (-) Transcript_30887:180-437(-)
MQDGSTAACANSEWGWGMRTGKSRQRSDRCFIPQLTLPLESDFQLVQWKLLLFTRLHCYLALHLLKPCDFAPSLAAALLHGHDAN